MGGIDDLQLPIERAIAQHAGRQHGVVTRRQLLELGLGPGAVDHRIRKAWLHVVHRGVYLVGHASLTTRGREIAAIRASGPTAVLSHRGATSFWELLPYLPTSVAVSVTVTNRNIESKPGIAVHRARSLPRRDWVIRDAIPVTTPARTILDLAAEAEGHELERALAEAQGRRLVSEHQLSDQIERNPGRTGTRALRRLLEVDGGPAPTRSEAERRMLELLRAAGLPRPQVNARVGRYEVDFLWSDERLVVEVDGYRFHSSRPDFELDRARDAELAARGYAVIRVTWRQLTAAREAVAARIAAALAHRA